jgi:predicted nucleic acid-binding protein
MIVLDTNVVSEPLKLLPEPRVEIWLDTQTAQTLFFTSVSLAELLIGIELLPDGKRKQGLQAKLDYITGRLFDQRILSFDTRAATIMSEINRHATRIGHNVTFADAQIAAIAVAHGFAVATRDIKPFRAMGVTVINPWNS